MKLPHEDAAHIRIAEQPRVKFSEAPKRHSDEAPRFIQTRPSDGEYERVMRVLPLETAAERVAAKAVLMNQFKYLGPPCTCGPLEPLDGHREDCAISVYLRMNAPPRTRDGVVPGVESQWRLRKADCYVKLSRADYDEAAATLAAITKGLDE